MNSRTLDGGLWLQPFVEDARGHRQEGSSQPRAAGRADRELEPVAAENERRCHHAVHPGAGLERPAQQVGLAEHAVQMHVEARQPVARAEPEARRHHTGVAARVDGNEIRRMRLRA